MVAADLICDVPGRRYGYEVYQQAMELGALLRPIEIHCGYPLECGMGNTGEFA